MAKLLFGTAGIPHSTKSGGSVEGIERIRELGLGCMELEFVRGVHMGKEAAEKVNEARKKMGVELSVHAPYFINLNAKEKSKLAASKMRIIQSARIGSIAGANIVVFHPAYYMKERPEIVYGKVKEALEDIQDKLKSENVKIRLGLETTGKGTQFGTLGEVLSLSKELKMVFPCVDFSHLHARCGGCLKGKKEFGEVVKELGKSGKSLLKDLHMHISGINYGPRGERNHLNFEDGECDFNYKALIDVLKDEKVGGTVICESPCLEHDALLMQRHYQRQSEVNERY